MKSTPSHNRFLKAVQLSQQAFGGYKKQILALTFFGFLSGILEGVGVNALIPLFSFAVEGEAAANDVISRAIAKLFSVFGLTVSVPHLLIFIIVLFVAKAFIVLYLNIIKVRITSDYEKRTRSELLSNVLNAKWTYLLKQKLGHLENIISMDVKQSGLLLEQISGVIMTSTSLLVYVIVAINISINLTLATLVAGVVIFFIFKRHFYITKRIGTDRAQTNKEIAHFINENVVGIKTVKTSGVSKPIMDRAEKLFLSLKKLAVEEIKRKTITTAFTQPIGVIFISAIFAFSYTSANFNLAILVAVVYLIQRIFTYIQQLQKALQSGMGLVPHLQSVVDYKQVAYDNRDTHKRGQKFQFNQAIIFDHVAFAYDRNSPVLKDVSFKVAKGEMVGIVGPSGAGKTTLVDLVLRLFVPQSGYITLDGVGINRIDLGKWRKNVGYVSQEIFLINDTIRNNIKFYNESMPDAEVVAAAKQANIHEFIETLPEKYNTLVGEQGVLLSGGQRQRVVIARVLARQPEILVLDEATSALDNESEIKIQEVIKKLKGRVTVLVIAHRLSTVMDSDKLLIINDGVISEQGKPQTLLKDKKSYFSKVYNIRD